MFNTFLFISVGVLLHGLWFLEDTGPVRVRGDKGVTWGIRNHFSLKINLLLILQSYRLAVRVVIQACSQGNQCSLVLQALLAQLFRACAGETRVTCPLPV